MDKSDLPVNLRIVVKRGPETLAVLSGSPMLISTTDLDLIIPTEQLLERLTGLRFHIEQEESS